MRHLQARVDRLEAREGQQPVGICTACAGAGWRAMLPDHRHAGPCSLDAQHGPSWPDLLRIRLRPDTAGKVQA